jgi:hypothetical protein
MYMGGINSGRRADTPSTDDCLRLSLTDLRKSGILQRHLWARREREWVELRTRRTVGSASIVADIDCRKITIKGSAFGQQIDQVFDVVAQPQPLGGERFYALCPITGQRSTVLYLPIGESVFASARGWGVPYASTRERDVARAYRRLDKAEKRWLSMSKYTRKRTRERILRCLIMDGEMVDRWEEQVMAKYG